MGPAPDTSTNSRRSIVFLGIVLLHVLMIYAFKMGLSQTLVEKIFGPTTAEIIEEKKQEEDKPPPPPPKLEAPPPFVPPPEISIEAPPADNSTAIVVTTQQRPVAAPPPAPVERKPVIVPPKAPRSGLSQPEFPPSERRAEHTGTVLISIYVLENGRVGDVKIQTSSGYPRLDEATANEAKRWRLTPGTEDGKATAMWVTVPIVFKLTN